MKFLIQSIYFLLFLIIVLSMILLCVMYVSNVRQITQVETTKEIAFNNISTEFNNNNYYDVTSEERYLLAKLAHSEGFICSEECQRDIVSVVFNRLESGKWRKDMNGDNKITIYDIIYYPNAFTPATNGAIDRWEPTSKDYSAVDYVIKNGPTVPTEVRYFRTSYDFTWDGYENYKVIDNVYFGYFVDWQKEAW